MSSQLKTGRETVSGKGPGRPRTFDEDQALAAAMRVFADKGYEATSLCDLTAAMGINRGSMYATFGNKETLFVRAMERFTRARENQVAACFSAGSAREAVHQLLQEGVRMFTNPEGLGVCFVTQGPFDASSVTEETRAFMARKRAGIEQSLKKLFEKYIETGELSRGVSAEELARFYSVVVQGMALQAQHGGTKEQLESVVAVAMGRWPRP